MQKGMSKIFILIAVVTILAVAYYFYMGDALLSPPLRRDSRIADNNFELVKLDRPRQICGDILRASQCACSNPEDCNDPCGNCDPPAAESCQSGCTLDGTTVEKTCYGTKERVCGGVLCIDYTTGCVGCDCEPPPCDEIPIIGCSDKGVRFANKGCNARVTSHCVPNGGPETVLP